MNMVLDASAILALILGEPGQNRVAEVLATAVIGAVNWAEAVTRLTRGGSSPQMMERAALMMAGRIEAFDEGQADVAGRLHGVTRSFGLSLGDRACLALALSRRARVLTADRAWAGLDVGVGIEVIR